MAVPVAPAAGEPIAEAWGDVVHDAVVAQDIQHGVQNITISNANSGTVTVTFPRPFAAVPGIQVTVVIGSSTLFAIASGLSAIAVDLRLIRKDEAVTTVTAPVHWLAIGPRA
jgi:hypothetical protein